MPKILITVTEDWAFLSHRVPTAMAARDAGYEVVVVARMRDHQREIEALGFRTVNWAIERESLNPTSEFRALRDLIRIYRQEKPDAVYHVAIKAIMYGTMAARFARVGTIFNLFSGLGVIFISHAPKLKLVRMIVTPVLRWIFKSPNTYLQVHNSDNFATLNNLGISTPDRTERIPGSGLDIENYPYTPEPESDVPMAMLVGRMLWDKGIGELAEAAQILKNKGINLRIVLVGAPDPANPASIPEAQLKAWAEKGLMEWWGQRNDVAEILKQSHIAVLPSYSEGMPRSLLEAASIGRPMVAFDTPGCSDLIRDGENGFLAPFNSSEALAKALGKLAQDKALRQRLGAEARKDVEQTYCADAVRSRLRDIFRSMS